MASKDEGIDDHQKISLMMTRQFFSEWNIFVMPIASSKWICKSYACKYVLFKLFRGFKTKNVVKEVLNAVSIKNKVTITFV